MSGRKQGLERRVRKNKGRRHICSYNMLTKNRIVSPLLLPKEEETDRCSRKRVKKKLNQEERVRTCVENETTLFV